MSRQLRKKLINQGVMGNTFGGTSNERSVDFEDSMSIKHEIPLQFKLSDTDKLENELAEFYSYSEIEEIKGNLHVFEEEAKLCMQLNTWASFTTEQKKSFIMKLQDGLDLQNREERLRHLKILLYIAQGCWNEVKDVNEQMSSQRINCMLLYNAGILNELLQMISLEYETIKKQQETANIRTVFAIIYTIIEIMRTERNSLNEEYLQEVNRFVEEIEINGDAIIFQFFNLTLEQHNGHFDVPIKKILLLLWKFILLYLGGSDKIKLEKYTRMKELGLNIYEDNEEMLEKYPINITSMTKIPWKSKVSQQDLHCFLEKVRKKYFGIAAPDDDTTLIGLPDRVLKSVNVLKDHVYIPLSEEQAKRSNFNKKHTTNVDLIYKKIMPFINDFIIVLGTIFQSAIEGHSSLNMNLYVEIFQINSATYTQYNVDINRHREIIFKAISGIVMLLLRHFKFNNIYQFEYLSVGMFLENFIRYMLVYLSYDQQKQCENSVCIKSMEFPYCVLNGPNRPSEETYSWKNMFSCINYLKIINKVLKHKPLRINVLTEAIMTAMYHVLKINNNLIQFYTLKIIKMVTKYMKKPRRAVKVNELSRIYLSIRINIFENWPYGAKQLTTDPTKEETELREKILNYNKQISKEVKKVYAGPFTDACNLPEDFEKHYEEWLEREVLQNPFDWDQWLNKEKKHTLRI